MKRNTPTEPTREWLRRVGKSKTTIREILERHIGKDVILDESILLDFIADLLIREAILRRTLLDHHIEPPRGFERGELYLKFAKTKLMAAETLLERLKKSDDWILNSYIRTSKLEGRAQ